VDDLDEPLERWSKGMAAFRKPAALVISSKLGQRVGVGVAAAVAASIKEANNGWTASAIFVRIEVHSAGSSSRQDVHCAQFSFAA
jgi:hypothetical protein